MAKNQFQTAAVVFEAGKDGCFDCEVRSKMGRFANVRKVADAETPEVSGDSVLTSNEAVLNSIWLAAIAYQAYQDSKVESEKETFLGQATELGKTATFLAELSDLLIDEFEEGYCSHCFRLTQQRMVGGKKTFICQTCGNATQHCAVPGCKHFATKFHSLENIASLCAEHRHDIPDFEKAEMRIADLADFGKLMEYKSSNVLKGAKYVATGVAALGVASGIGFAAAPAIGGIVGSTFLGYSGAVATNAGLAALGFGSLASGGLGMAGGTLVVSAAGAMLGTAFGTKVASAWISEDKSFKITKLRDGNDGVPVLIARGFTTEKSLDWRSPVRAVEKVYPQSPIYLIEWGSKEVQDLAVALGVQAGGAAAGRLALKAVAKASKTLAKMAAPITPLLTVADLAKNPWHVAVNRANKTGLALATLIKKSDMSECVLVGHSLGGRVMINAAQALASETAPVVSTMHLFGAASGQREEWDALEKAVSGPIHNYHSSNDPVLKYLYPVAQLGKRAVGFDGFNAVSSKIIDHDVSQAVQNHGKYYDLVGLEASSG
ncbi:DUF726 domain-containing protein [Corynebacterium sp. H128]|uniref:DUF726 domain-containing protein n=1 Tax=Corynebacterium sp. H128 TaxID=3133427 RepID=UPI00309A68EE